MSKTSTQDEKPVSMTSRTLTQDEKPVPVTSKTLTQYEKQVSVTSKTQEEKPMSMTCMIKTQEEKPMSVTCMIKTQEEKPMSVTCMIKTQEEKPMSVTCMIKTQEEKPTLHMLFRKAAEEFPENVAIVYDNGHTKEHMTYDMLLSQASVVEHLIEDHRCNHQVIGLVLQSGVSVPPALLGVLLSESAFIHIDVDIPISQLHYLIKQLHITLLLVQPHWVLNLKKKLECFCPEVGHIRGHVRGQAEGRVRCQVGGHVRGKVGGQVEGRVRGHLGNEDLLLSSLYLRQVDHVTCESSLAYVMSTSGTTGTPKLVKVPHQCIVPNILHLRYIFHVGPADIVFQASPLTFDPSIVEMFIAITTGAVLLLVPDRVKLNPANMVDILCQNKTTIIQATPTLISSIGSSRLQQTLLAAGSALRILALGGEMCPPFPVLRGWRGVGNGTSFYNLYGITEVSCWASCYSLTECDLRSDRTDVPLGEVLEGTQLKIHPQPGEETERGVLWIGGNERVCLIDGEEAKKTAVFRNSSDGIVYRNSGDVVARDSSGQITFQGRTDEQIKRHGKRLDLVELEQIVACSDIVQQAAAVYDTVNRRLGLVVSVDPMTRPHALEGSAPSDSPQGGSRNASDRCTAVKAEIEQLLSAHLPSYYFPDVIVIRETLPMTTHGKVDKKQLMLLDEFKLADQRQPHQTNSEAVTFIWKDCLQLSDNNPSDLTANFLELGGSSLSALVFVSRVESVFPGVTLSVLLDVTLHKTLADILVCLERTLAMQCCIDTSVEDTDDRMGGYEGGVTRPRGSGEHHGQVHSLGGGKGELYEDSCHSLMEIHMQTLFGSGGVTSRRRAVEKLSAVQCVDHSHLVQTSDVNSQLGRCTTQKVFSRLQDKVSLQEKNQQPGSNTYEHSIRKRKLSDTNYLSEEEPYNSNKHTEECQKQGHIDGDCTHFVKNQENVMRNINVFVYSVERGNRTNTDLSSRANYMPTVLAGGYISIDTPSVTEEHISVHTSSVPGEHISVNTTDVPKENISVNTLSVSGKHISVDTSSVQEEMIGATNKMATNRGIVGRHPSDHHQPLQADDVSHLSHLVVMETWQHDTGKCVDASPLVAVRRDGSRVGFIGSHSQSFVALDLRSGHVIWRVQLGGRIEGSACLSKCGRLVMVGSYDGRLYVLEALTGDIFWQFQTGAEVKSSPCVDPTNGHVYFGSHDHCLYALDVLKQTVVWRLELGGSVFSSPCICLQPHCVYAATLGGSLSAVSPELGTSLWRCMLGKPLFSSPVAIQLGVVIGCVDGAIYCVSHLGQKLWQLQTEAPVFSSPCVSSTRSVHSGTNQVVVFGSHDDHIYCIDSNGGLQWKVKVDSPIYSTPFVFPFHISQHACGQKETTVPTHGSTHQTKFCHRQMIENLQDSACIPMPANNSKPSGSCENIQRKHLIGDTISDRETMPTDVQEKHVCVDLVAACSTRGRMYIVTLVGGRVVTSHQFPGEMFSSPVAIATDGGFDVLVGCRDDFVYCLKYT